MKKIILLCLLVCGVNQGVYSQTYIVDEEFNSAPTAPANWTFSGGAFGSSSGSGNFGRNAPAPKFVLNAQAMTYTWTGVSNDPDNVWFIYRGEGSAADCAASSILVEESSNGTTRAWIWGEISTAEPIVGSPSRAFNSSAVRPYIQRGLNSVNFISATSVSFQPVVRYSLDCFEIDLRTFVFSPWSRPWNIGGFRVK